MSNLNGNMQDIKNNTLVKVELQIEDLKKSGGINFPENYSHANALKAAWLVLQDTKDKSQKYALDVCTRESIYTALFDMVIQGLSVAKKQGYFVVYGDKLQFTRSYFGTIAVTKRLKGVRNVVGQVIYEGDVFEYGFENGIKKIFKHEQELANIKPDKIIGAYAMVLIDGIDPYVEIMTKQQIDKSWAKSKTQQAVHKEFPDQMAIRTVINRCCKTFANTSDDSDLLIESFNRTVGMTADEEVAAEIEDNANKQTVTINADNYEFVQEDGAQKRGSVTALRTYSANGTASATNTTGRVPF